MEEYVAFFSLEMTKDKKGVIGAVLCGRPLGNFQLARSTCWTSSSVLP